MRVYSLNSVDSADGLHAVNDSDYPLLRSIGLLARQMNMWSPVRVLPSSTVRGGRAKTLMDIAHVSGMRTIPALSQRAHDCLAASLSDRVEWLPLESPGSNFYIANVIRASQALDYSLSILEKDSSGKVNNIQVYAFNEIAVANELIFKVPDWTYDVLVTDAFVDLVKENRLKGFFFSPVWDSNVAPFKCRPTTADVPLRKDVYGPGGIMTGFNSYWPKEWKSA